MELRHHMATQRREVKEGNQNLQSHKSAGSERYNLLFSSQVNLEVDRG